MCLKNCYICYRFALEHLSRICRLLSISGGCALLVGVSGSGRQTLTRLAAAICTFNIFQPEITKNYGKHLFGIYSFIKICDKLFYDIEIGNISEKLKTNSTAV